MNENGHTDAEITIPVVDEDYDPLPQPPGPPPAATIEAEYDPYRSLLRLLVGGALVTANELSRRIAAFEEAYRASETTRLAPSPGPITDPQWAVHTAVGMIFAGYDGSRQAAKRVLSGSGAISKLGRAALRPAARSRVLRPARRRLRGLAARGKAELANWEETGRAEDAHSRTLARALFNVSADDLVDYLSTNAEIDKLIDSKVDAMLAELESDPQVTSLIQAQVGLLLPQLANDPDLMDFVQSVAEKLIVELPDDPALSELIRKQGDGYLSYLEDENPEQIQDLIQGQSVGMAGQMLNEVRERTVTADSIVESIVRGILRRPPRAEMPPPPPEVLQLVQTQTGTRRPHDAQRAAEENPDE